MYSNLIFNIQNLPREPVPEAVPEADGKVRHPAAHQKRKKETLCYRIREFNVFFDDFLKNFNEIFKNFNFLNF